MKVCNINIYRIGCPVGHLPAVLLWMWRRWSKCRGRQNPLVAPSDLKQNREIQCLTFIAG